MHGYHVKALDAASVFGATGAILHWFTPVMSAVAALMSVAWLGIQFYLFIRDKKWRRDVW